MNWNYLKCLLLGHKYIFDHASTLTYYGEPCGIRHFYICEKCLKVKKVNFD